MDFAILKIIGYELKYYVLNGVPPNLEQTPRFALVAKAKNFKK